MLDDRNIKEQRVRFAKVQQEREITLRHASEEKEARGFASDAGNSAADSIQPAKQKRYMSETITFATFVDASA